VRFNLPSGRRHRLLDRLHQTLLRLSTWKILLLLFTRCLVCRLNIMLILCRLNSTTPGNSANSLVLDVTPTNISSVVGQVSAMFGTLQPGQISPTGPALGTALQNIWEPIQNWFNQGSGSSQRRDSYSKSTTWNIASLTRDVYNSYGIIRISNTLVSIFALVLAEVLQYLL
jgi:hypothetical protein